MLWQVNEMLNAKDQLSGSTVMVEAAKSGSKKIFDAALDMVTNRLTVAQVLRFIPSCSGFERAGMILATITLNPNLLS